jgi:hypothetical protein
MDEVASLSGESRLCFQKERRKKNMAEEQKKKLEDFRAFFEGTPCAEMMKKMMGGKKEGQRFNCAEIMPQMIQMFCRAKEKKEASSQEGKETQSPHS